MAYTNERIEQVAVLLRERANNLADKSEVLRAPELRALFSEIATLPADQRSAFGKEVNALKQELQTLVAAGTGQTVDLAPIDVTAPWGINTPPPERPAVLDATHGSRHPLMQERQRMLDIFHRMGFSASESREIDDDFHMFEALNFPEGHPAKDDYDTFVTIQKDKTGKALIAPAHTSTMQNRILTANKHKLEQGQPIAVLVPDRVYRNEDLDARHEHTFYQHEGIYVDRGINAGHLMATLKTFLQEYYGKEIDIKTQPFYFPFTEPSFEFALSCPFCDKKGCNVCSYSGWIELLGCGMIHPNVLKMAGIDPNVYTGFAWGGGIDRLVMMRFDIEDVRHFHSGKLEFLRQFP